jgi:hypothetical protein
MSGAFVIWNRSYREGFCVITKLEGFNDQWLLLKGVSLDDKWPDNVSFRMSPQYPKDINLSDNLFGGSYRVVSGRLKEVLLPLAGKSNIEFLPVSILNHKKRVASKDYFVLNPLDTIDCIDQEESGVVWNAIDPSVISNCEKFVLKEDAIPDESVMFRPRFWGKTILVRREIADKLAAAGLTGLSFLEPSKYTG